MSQRTRQSRGRTPGAAAVNRPSRYLRQVEHRRVRRAAHVELSTSTLAEPEDHALPRPVHSSMKIDPADKPEVEVRSKRFKVWKTKAWKRRTNQRARKAAALRTVTDS